MRTCMKTDIQNVGLSVVGSVSHYRDDRFAHRPLPEVLSEFMGRRVVSLSGTFLSASAGARR
jgi:hypothetical protein